MCIRDRDYTVVIDHMLEYWPEATIYMQTVPDSVTGVVATERINGIIEEAVAHYEELGDTRVKLLDTNSCWGSGCYLPDGAHLTDVGLRAWYESVSYTHLWGYAADIQRALYSGAQPAARGRNRGGGA